MYEEVTGRKKRFSRLNKKELTEEEMDDMFIDLDSEE